MKLAASSLLVLLAACSSSESSPAKGPVDIVDSGSDASAGTKNDAGSSNDAATIGTDDDGGTSVDCSGKGTAVAADWSFASSAATLNGGKGQVLSVHVCDTVTWTNSDTGVPHSVVSQTSSAFSFMTNQANGVISLMPVQFTQAGTFDYECGVHGSMMLGEITVAP